MSEIDTKKFTKEELIAKIREDAEALYRSGTL